MFRYKSQQLQAWVTQKDRKPLIFRGVRQVGKTYLLKQLGESSFPAYHYFNFEEKAELAKIFEFNLDPVRIINELSIGAGRPINIATDLVIFDEIQAAPKVLTSLKYFRENMPELALCSAGSLLGLQLTPTSYPVGMVDTLSLHPMSFTEFLLALGDQAAVDLLMQCQRQTSLSEFIHRHLWERLKWYFIVGGLPEVVSIFAEHQDNLFVAFEQVREKQYGLISAYYADIAKHAGKESAMHIDRVWRSVPSQLSRSQDGSVKRFQFQGVVPGIDRYTRLASVFDWLIAAELVIKIPIVNCAHIPLSAHAQENRFKLFLFDVGLLGAMSRLSPKAILDYDYGTYKGYFAENFVAQAFVFANHQPIYCWEENRAEVEFLREIDSTVIPIEVKSGWVARAKSLQKFQDKYHAPYRAVLSGRPLLIDQSNQIHQYPLYLAERFPIE